MCRACYADAPDRRSICANEKCRELVCRDCADKGARCPRCGISTDYMALFEEESRECPICQEVCYVFFCYIGQGCQDEESVFSINLVLSHRSESREIARNEEAQSSS